MRPPGGPLGPGPPSLGAPRSAGHRGRAGSGCGWVGAALAPVLCLLSKPVFKRSPKSPARQTPVRFGSVGNNSAAAGCLYFSSRKRVPKETPRDKKGEARAVCPLGAPAARGSPWTRARAAGRWRRARSSPATPGPAGGAAGAAAGGSGREWGRPPPGTPRHGWGAAPQPRAPRPAPRGRPSGGAAPARPLGRPARTARPRPRPRPRPGPRPRPPRPPSATRQARGRGGPWRDSPSGTLGQGQDWDEGVVLLVRPVPTTPCRWTTGCCSASAAPSRRAPA